MTFIIISCVTFTKILTKTVGGLQSYFVSDVRVHDNLLGNAYRPQPGALFGQSLQSQALILNY